MDPLIALLVVLVLLWLGGFSLGVGGSLIHLLLAVAVIVLFVRLVQGKSG